jgi:hypothetical protein
MGWGDEVDRLIGRITLFERWYMDGYSGLMADLNTYCSCFLRKDFEHVSEEECRSSIETALARLEEHYSNIPYDAIENDVFSSHISVIDELWEPYRSKISSAVSGGYAEEGDLGLESRTIMRVCEGLSRCVTLDKVEEATINSIKSVVPLIREGARIIQLYPETGKDLADEVTSTLKDLGLIYRDIMARRYCDRDVAPLIVSKYLVQDMIYSARDLLENSYVWSYIEVSELTFAAAQVNELFRKRFSATLEKLQMVPGYESFQTEVRDVEGGLVKYHELIWEERKDG